MRGDSIGDPSGTGGERIRLRQTEVYRIHSKEAAVWPYLKEAGEEVWGHRDFSLFWELVPRCK